VSFYEHSNSPPLHCPHHVSANNNSDTNDDKIASTLRNTTAVTPRWCPAEVRYGHKNYSLKTLVALCRGLKDNDGNDLMDIKSYPWSKLKASYVKPNNHQEYSEEIMRRYDLMKSLPEELPQLLQVAPQPKAWQTDKLMGWLGTHPVPGSEDVAYLTKIVNNRKALAKDVAEQQDAVDESSKKNWTELDGENPLSTLNPLSG
jgi:hypothetical protein